MSDDAVRIVVVDDSADSAQTMAVLLRLSGYDVRTAGSGQDALALIEETAPHCVIFDVVMPGLDGNELCALLRSRYGDAIVLIAVSGAAPSDARVRESFALADHYFTKPVTVEMLSRVLRPLV
ncbi:MAG: response regulator [Caldimonas sp.]